MTKEQPLLVRWRLKYRGRYEAATMVIFCLLVYSWALTALPTGKDLAFLANPDTQVSGISVHIVECIRDSFSTYTFLYRSVSLLLMYACMLGIYGVIRFSIAGPFWLGTLGAVLFMAHPATTGAVTSLYGWVYLLPASLALASLVTYAFAVRSAHRLYHLGAFVLCAVSTLLFREIALLPVCIVLFDRWIIPKRLHKTAQLTGYVTLTLVSLIYHGTWLLWAGSGSWDRVTPLYFLLYPLGFLPATLFLFSTYPWMAWIAGITVVVLLCLIINRATHPALLFGIVSAVLFQLSVPADSIDKVHLIGGESMIPTSAVYHVGLVALFFRMMQHPRWQKTIISATTILCMAYMGMQLHHIYILRSAVSYLETYRVQAIQHTEDAPVVVCPDYRAWRGIPLQVSSVLAHDTPFGSQVLHHAILPVDYVPGLSVGVDVSNNLSWLLDFEGATALDILFPVTGMVHPGEKYMFDNYTATLVDVYDNGFQIQVDFETPVEGHILTFSSE